MGCNYRTTESLDCDEARLPRTQPTSLLPKLPTKPTAMAAKGKGGCDCGDLNAREGVVKAFQSRGRRGGGVLVAANKQGRNSATSYATSTSYMLGTSLGDARTLLAAP